jgi:DNA polymerase-3 subunit delta'
MKTFSEIIGQERAIGFLKKAIASGRIPHAFLFTGISGVGKTTTATAFTQAINCLEPVENEGCGKCLICRQMSSGNFPDLIFFEPDGQNIKIEQIRELNRSLSFKPLAGKYRVTIVNEAETMTEDAANSFLKTLEEPPPGNVLILKTVEPRDLLSTVVSRCQRIPFQPLLFQVIKEWLMKEMYMDKETACLVARLSEGSLGRAVKIAETNFQEEREERIADIVQLPVISKYQLLVMAQEYAGKAKKTDREESKTTDLSELFGIWKTWYRDLIIMKMNSTHTMLINADFSRELKNVSKKITIDNLIEGFIILDQAQRDLSRNLNPGLIVENALLNLKRLSD